MIFDGARHERLRRQRLLLGCETELRVEQLRCRAHLALRLSHTADHPDERLCIPSKSRPSRMLPDPFLLNGVYQETITSFYEVIIPDNRLMKRGDKSPPSPHTKARPGGTEPIEA